MKKLLFMILLLAPMAVMAQKFGHVNTQDIIQAMPEYTKAKTEIDALQKQYEAEPMEKRRRGNSCPWQNQSFCISAA